MLPLGIILGFASYTVTTWGYILVKGYNITLREWVTPLHPFTGKLDANGMVPQGSIFPTSGKGAKAAAGSGGGPAPKSRTNPGLSQSGALGKH